MAGMDLSGSNPRDNVRTMGGQGKEKSSYVAPGRVNGLGKASEIPSYTTFEDFDVFSGGKGLGQEEYMQGTFHTSAMKEGDAIFKQKAEDLQDTSGSLLNESRRFRTAEDMGEEEDLNEQEKESAL